jgi:hypothetical protein
MPQPSPTKATTDSNKFTAWAASGGKAAAFILPSPSGRGAGGEGTVAGGEGSGPVRVPLDRASRQKRQNRRRSRRSDGHAREDRLRRRWAVSRWNGFRVFRSHDRVLSATRRRRSPRYQTSRRLQYNGWQRQRTSRAIRVSRHPRGTMWLSAKRALEMPLAPP